MKRDTRIVGSGVSTDSTGIAGNLVVSPEPRDRNRCFEIGRIAIIALQYFMQSFKKIYGKRTCPVDRSYFSHTEVLRTVYSSRDVTLVNYIPYVLSLT